MHNIKVVFMGTPNFSVPVLNALIKNTNVVLVVTSSDAYVGRKKVLTACPVKELAISNGIEVYSPEKIRNDFEIIKRINPDMIVTCAYGQILPEELLNIPKYGSINVHASLLPKYRGGAPIHHAIMDGEEYTGVTIMYMDKGMDSGDIIKEESIKIEDNDNIDTLSNKLSILGSKMIIESIPSIIDGTNDRVKQDESKVTFAPIIKREDEHLSFNKTAKEVFNKVRALSPHPLANFIMDDSEYKIAECEIVESTGEVNHIVFEDKNSFVIQCQDKGIKVTKIKSMGKNIMNVSDFKNGYHDKLAGKELL